MKNENTDEDKLFSEEELVDVTNDKTKIKIETNSSYKNEVETYMNVHFNGLLSKLEENTDNFWKELDSIKFQLFSYKNEVENMSNEFIFFDMKSIELNCNSKIEKFDISKKLKDEKVDQNKAGFIRDVKVVNKGILTKQNTVSDKSGSIISNPVEENKLVDIEIKFNGVNNTPSLGPKLKISNSHSPLKKSKITMKMDNKINANYSSNLQVKKEKVKDKTPISNSKPINLDASNNQNTNGNVKTFSPVNSKLKLPNTNSKSKPLSLGLTTKKSEDPKQIEINLSEDIKFLTDSGTQKFNNHNHIVISANDEIQDNNI